jgi:hypothetical protein
VIAKEFWNIIKIGESLGKILRFLLLMLITSFTIYSQTKSNLEVLYSLTDSLSNQILYELPAEQESILLTLNLGNSYSVFSNNIKTIFIENGKRVLEKPPDELNIPVINIVIESAGIEYGEMFRDGWFGDHYAQRKAYVSGNYLQSFSIQGKKEFQFSVADTINVDEVKELESDPFPFTKGVIPPEPFLSNLAEPVIAIGTAAVVIALFFSIRSK